MTEDGRDETSLVREYEGYLRELEGIVIFLSAPASDLITGQTIYIDGGWTIW